MGKQNDTFEVGIWISDSLYSYADYYCSGGYAPRDGLIKWIKDAFSIGPHSINVVKGDKINVPGSDDFYDSKFCYQPCWKDTTVCYNDSLDWWESFYSNTIANSNCPQLSSAADVRVLCTTGTKGGLSKNNGRYAVLNLAGNDYCGFDDNPYQTYGSGTDTRFEAFRIALHHIGHCLLYVSNPHDVGRINHQRGTTDFYETPMGISGDENICSDNHHGYYDVPRDSDGDATQWRMEWSECAMNKFRSSYY